MTENVARILFPCKKSEYRNVIRYCATLLTYICFAYPYPTQPTFLRPIINVITKTRREEGEDALGCSRGLPKRFTPVSFSAVAA